MAGPGFEPGKAVPCGLQPHPFDRSGIPPGPLSLTRGTYSATSRTSKERAGRRWLGSTSYSSVLRSSEKDSAAPAESGGGDVPPPPIARMYEERVAARRIEALHDPIPALVTAAGAKGHVPAVIAPARRCLHLHTIDAIAEVCDEVVVGVLKQRFRDERPDLGQPADRRQLAGVALPSRCPDRFHAWDHTFAFGRKPAANCHKSATKRAGGHDAGGRHAPADPYAAGPKCAGRPAKNAAGPKRADRPARSRAETRRQTRTQRRATPRPPRLPVRRRGREA